MCRQLVLRTSWNSSPVKQPVSKLSWTRWWQGRKRRESLKLRLWNLNSTSNSPVAPHQLSNQISVNQCKAENNENKIYANIEKHVPRVMRTLLMSSPPISISHQLFRCRYSNSRDIVANPPSFSRPAAKAPRRAVKKKKDTASPTYPQNNVSRFELTLPSNHATLINFFNK